MTRDLLASILDPGKDGASRPAFALLHRPGTAPGLVDVLVGTVTHHERIADVDRPDARAGGAGSEVLLLLPFRQLAERGFECSDDGAPLVALRVEAREQQTLADVVARIPTVPTPLLDERFDLDDAAYADVVRRVVADEIATGVGANFVIKRTYSARLDGPPLAAASSAFRQLLEREAGTHWTFLVSTGDRLLVGASPERHVTLDKGVAVMNPISGTYRYPATGPTLDGLLEFLADGKETEELHMVLDEELKMMAQVCEEGGRVRGPFLKEMAHLAHTEYYVEGRTSRGPLEILAETMFAPTVTGSPLESACRVIRRHEPGGRGYYSGVAALLSSDDEGRPAMDSTILIRTAEVEPSGSEHAVLRISVGATLVRDSSAEAEVAETRAKAEGLLRAFHAPARRELSSDPRVRAALARKNQNLARFWLGPERAEAAADIGLAGARVLVVDAEDTFSAMVAHHLRAQWADVTVRRFDEPYEVDEYDFVVLGPGPGDPTDPTDPRVRHLRRLARTLLASGRPFGAICLSHQVLSLELGLAVVRRSRPNQGTQAQIDLFGRTERVGFYNSFVALSGSDSLRLPGGDTVAIARDASSGEVHALRGPTFSSVQFHAESVLTPHGDRLLAELCRPLHATRRFLVLDQAT